MARMALMFPLISYPVNQSKPPNLVWQVVAQPGFDKSSLLAARHEPTVYQACRAGKARVYHLLFRHDPPQDLRVNLCPSEPILNTTKVMPSPQFLSADWAIPR